MCEVSRLASVGHCPHRVASAGLVRILCTSTLIHRAGLVAGLVLYSVTSTVDTGPARRWRDYTGLNLWVSLGHSEGYRGLQRAHRASTGLSRACMWACGICACANLVITLCYLTVCLVVILVV